MSKSLSLAAVILGASLFGSAYLVVYNQKERVVTVKGLVERDVVANMATWSLATTAVGNELSDVQSKIDGNISTIKNFLIEKGFKGEDIDVPSINVTDRQALEYGEQKAGQLRYVIRSSVNLRSSNIELVQKVSRLTNELVKAGITLTASNCSGPSFTFTDLNSIKPEMLIEATKNARRSGDQFALDSESKLGQIKRASQGVFSISERDKVVVEGGGGQDYCNSNPNKTVRVVTTIDYYLE